MKIAYCGYDFFHACLSDLLVSRHDVHRVFSFPCDNRYNFNRYIRELCRQHSIPFSEQRMDENAVTELAAEGCELIITAGYRYKIPDLTAYSIRGINIHPTLLPAGRGVWPLPWTILTAQKYSGVTIHQLSGDYDAGHILAQRDFLVDVNERLESLSAKAQLLATDLLRSVMLDFGHYWHSALPQRGEVIEWGMPSKEQRTLDWHSGVADLDRLCRAFGKFGCFAFFEQRNWVVYGLTAWQYQHAYDIGAVVHKTNTEMIVAASDGLVSLLYFDPMPA